jgi:hypothetical protein
MGRVQGRGMERVQGRGRERAQEMVRVLERGWVLGGGAEVSLPEQGWLWHQQVVAG